ANSFSNDVSVLLGRGDGTFRPGTSLAVGANPFYLVAGDFDGDGGVDLAAADYTSRDVLVVLGRGDGSFPAVSTAVSAGQPLVGRTGSLVDDDFDDDGNLVLVVTLRFTAESASGKAVVVLRGDGGGGIGEGLSIPAGREPGPLVAGDFDGDGHLDLATGDAG